MGEGREGGDYLGRDGEESEKGKLPGGAINYEGETIYWERTE
jgi:hypothetical protein